MSGGALERLLKQVDDGFTPDGETRVLAREELAERKPHSGADVDRTDYWLSDAPNHASHEFLNSVAAEDARILAQRVRDLEEQFEVYREFYTAWWEVEKGVADFDLHSEAVTRLSEAHAAVIRLDSNPAKERDA